MLYGENGGDGASFKDYDGAYGPYVDTAKVIPGTYTLHFHFASEQDANIHTFAGAKEYDPIDVKIKVTKTSQKLTVKSTAKSVKSAKLKKKSVVIAQAIKVTGAKTSVTYKKKSGSKYLIVNKNTGTITVKKKTPKGKYTAKIIVKADTNRYYAAASKTVTVTVVVK